MVSIATLPSAHYFVKVRSVVTPQEIVAVFSEVKLLSFSATKLLGRAHSSFQRRASASIAPWRYPPLNIVLPQAPIVALNSLISSN